MHFISNLQYRLGTSFDENNIDLELRKDFKVGKLYSSYRYSEVHLFGKVFESVCYLWFMKDKLSTIEYRFSKRFLGLFIKCINEELPIYNQLGQDPNMEKHKYYVYHNRVAVNLVNLDENYFILRVSVHPSLPRISKLE